RPAVHVGEAGVDRLVSPDDTTAPVLDVVVGAHTWGVHRPGLDVERAGAEARDGVDDERPDVDVVHDVSPPDDVPARGDLLVTQEVDEGGLQREGAHRPADVATDVVARDVVSHTGRHIDGTPRERVTGPYRHRRRRAVRVGVVSAVARSAEVGRTAVTAVVEG